MLRTHPIIRFLNQNRREIRNVILVIIVFFLALRLLNNMAEEKKEKELMEENKIQTELVLTNTHKEVIENFLTFCVKGDESSAYALLSTECKESFKDSNELKTNYIQKYFSTNKNYTITYSTSINEEYVYFVKIKEDILSTGNINENTVTQYFTVIQENGIDKIKIENY